MKKLTTIILLYLTTCLVGCTDISIYSSETDKSELKVKQVNTEEIVGYIIDNNKLFSVSLSNATMDKGQKVEEFSTRIMVCCVYTEGDEELYECVYMRVNRLTNYFEYMTTLYEPRVVYKETIIYEDNSEETIYRLGDLIDKTK